MLVNLVVVPTCQLHRRLVACVGLRLDDLAVVARNLFGVNLTYGVGHEFLSEESPAHVDDEEDDDACNDVPEPVARVNLPGHEVPRGIEVVGDVMKPVHQLDVAD